MAPVIKVNLLPFWHQKEIKLGRSITYKEVATATGMGWRAVAKLKEGKTTRFDAPILAALCAYFDVPEGPIPFLTVHYDSNGGGK